jgi:CopG family nickel-responsive transcriptional regulator
VIANNLITRCHLITVISVSVPEKLLKMVEHSIAEQGFANRSEIVRQSLRSFLSETRSLKELAGEVTASITIIYERETRNEQVSDIHHNFGEIISTFLHAHIDENYCLEVIVVKGAAQKLRCLVDAFRTNEQISQIKVSVLKTPE